MFVFRFAAMGLAVAVSVLGWGSAEAAGPLHAFKLGFWSGGAYTDDRTGNFTHCSAGVAYDSGINMFILVTSGYRWWLGFIDPQWAFPPKTQLEVELRLDRGAPFQRVAIVPRGQLLLVPLPYDSHLVDTLRGSSQLTLSAEQESFRFKLSDTAAVLEELTGCVRGSVALETRPLPAQGVAPASLETKPPQPDAATRSEPAPAAAAAVPPAPSPQASREAPMAFSPGAPSPALQPAASLDTPAAPQTPVAAAAPSLASAPQTLAPLRPTALEEIRLAQDFFTTAQLPNARLVVTDKPAALASFTAVWRSDNAAGAVKIIPPGPDVSGVGIASNLIAVDPQMCKGNFATARSSATVGNSVVFSATLSCTEANEQRSAQYFITSRRQGGFVVFAVVGKSALSGGIGADPQSSDLFARAAVRAAQNDL